jgi:surface protein
MKAWYENGTIYYAGGNVVMNSDSSAMFKNCSNLTDISVLSTWNTSNVTSLYDFFNGCSSLTDVSAVENWNVSSVSDMRSIFYGI